MSNIISKLNFILLQSGKIHFWPSLAILTLTTVFFRNFLFTSQAPAGIDAKGFISRPWYLLQNGEIWSLWHSQFSFGFIRLPTVDTALAILYSLVNDPVLGLKLFAIGAFILAAASMYFVTLKYTGRKLSAAISAIVFSSNQFIFSYYTSGVYNVIAAYCISPIIFYTFEKMISTKTWRSIAGFSISFSILCMFTRVDMATFFAPFLFFLLVCNCLNTPKSQNKLELLKSNFKVCLISGLMVIGLTSFLWLPMVMGARLPLPSSSGGFSNEDLYFRSLSLYETILGHGRGLSYLALNGDMWWNKHPFLSLFQYRLASSLLPILALIPILIKPNKKIVIYSLAILLSIFLAKGPNEPFGSLYIWARNEIPFFGIYRIPNRWLLITYFFYSFLFGLGFQILWDKSHESIKIIKNMRSVRIIMRSAITVLLSVLLVALLVPITPIVEKGFLTWDYPDSEKESYDIISQDPQNFIVATVPFAQGNINTSVSNTFSGKGWWEHDLGSESSLFHNKPAIHQTPAGGLSNSFVKFAKQVTYNPHEKSIMPLLGNVGIKYVINQSYPITDFGPVPSGVTNYQQHEFFRNQKGAELVSNINEGSEVYENSYFAPFVSARKGLTLVVGGKNSLIELGNIDPSILESGLMLVSDVDFSKRDALTDLLPKIDKIIFVDSSIYDLAILASKSTLDKNILHYSSGGMNPDSGWISDDTQSNLGKFTYHKNSLTTKSSNDLVIPFKSAKSQIYEMWVRVYSNPYAGQLNFEIDGVEVGSIDPTTATKEAFFWKKISEHNIDQGQHILNVKNTKGLISNKSTLDHIVIMPKTQYQSNLKTITEYLETSNIQITAVHTNSFLEPVIHGYPQTFKARSIDLIEKDPSTFWNPFGPNASDIIKIEEEFYDTPPVNFPLSTKIEIPDIETPSYTFVTHNFDHPQDWTYAKTISVWFKGKNDGSKLYFLAKLDTEYRYFDFKDTSDEWREIIFELKNKNSSRGQGVSWDRVNAIGFGRQEKQTESTFYIGPITIGTVDRSSDKLPDTFMILPTKDTYEISILGATGPKYGSLTLENGNSQKLTFGSAINSQTKNINGEYYFIESNPIIQFGELDYKSDSLFNSLNWKSTDPDNIDITTDNETVTLDLIQKDRKYFAIAELKLPGRTYMPNSGTFSFTFNGTGSNTELNMVFYYGEDQSLKLSWMDDNPDPSIKTFEFEIPNNIKDLSLKSIKLSTVSKDDLGTFKIGNIKHHKAKGELLTFDGVSSQKIITKEDNNDLSPSSYTEYKFNDPRPYYAFLEYIPGQEQRNISNNTHISFKFKGSGNNQIMGLTLASPSTKSENMVSFNWIDNSTAWEEKIFELNYPTNSKGSIDWADISSIKFSTTDKSSKMILGLANVHLVSSYDDPTFTWIKSPNPISIKGNLKSEKLTSNGMTDIDLIIATTKSNYPIVPSSVKEPKISFVKRTSSLYDVQVESSQPTLLAFAQGYHKLWKANIGEEYVQPIPLYSVINGFPINKIGQYSLTIEFTGEKFARYGGVISLSFLFLILMGCFNWSSITSRKIHFSISAKTINITIPHLRVKLRREIHKTK